MRQPSGRAGLQVVQQGPVSPAVVSATHQTPLGSAEVPLWEAERQVLVEIQVTFQSLKYLAIGSYAPQCSTRICCPCSRQEVFRVHLVILCVKSFSCP